MEEVNTQINETKKLFMRLHLIDEHLKKYQTDFLILEDSICLSPSRDNQCSLKEILDIVNGHVNLFILFDFR